MRMPRRSSVVASCVAVCVVATGLFGPAAQAAPADTKHPTAEGSGGGVATVDLDASRVGVEVLRAGGNAVDAAVAAAATLGVTEPYSAGLGGGGYFVYYQAATGRVLTIDGRETAPAAMGEKAFLDPATGKPLAFADAVTSGLSVGVPGTPATWADALRRWGTLSLSKALAPATAVAERGFTVDATFRQQTADNAARFAHFTSTKALYLPGGQPPAVGSTFRNPDLARTYRAIAANGVAELYQGDVARDIVATASKPPVVPGDTYNARPGLIRPPDLARYRAIPREPTRVPYRGLDVYGMGPSSSGGTTVGEALNILSRVPLSGSNPAATVQSLHYYLEASRLAFADRNRYVGDPAQVRVPTQQLLSRGFGTERACLIDPKHAATSPVAPGVPDAHYTRCPVPAGATAGAPAEGPNTTGIVASDRWGNVVSYILTIEQTGGSGIVVPGRGFLLNNELTDFNFAPTQGAAPDPNLPAPGKRPRSSIAPTIVLRDGHPFLAVASPGGATIITTVLQTLVNRLDLGLTLPDAIAAPRASQRNVAAGADAEPAFVARYGAPLAAYGQKLVSGPEIGAAVGLELRPRGRVLVAAEPVRRGGGSALVARPAG